MARRAIREFDGKRLLAQGLEKASGGRFRLDPRRVLVGPDTALEALPKAHPWLLETRLVVKPDQLFGKRGKNKLLGLNLAFDEVKRWIGERMQKEITISQTTGQTTGRLTHFLVEPFIPHGRECYLGITTSKDHDSIFFSEKGGVDIEEAWDSVVETRVGLLEPRDQLAVNLPAGLAERETMQAFIRALYQVFVEYHFTYLEVNPLALEQGKVLPMDLKARLDDYATFQCGELWAGEGGAAIEFPKPFGSVSTPEERRVEEIDERTGASLKLTVLNPDGRIWNLVAGGGASVIYADTVVDLGLSKELANYGEYSGDPSAEDTYEYTRVVLSLMTRAPDAGKRPKFLLIGGGIANFTDVASTFTGIIRAIEEYRDKLRAVNARILVRRGGPNFEAGLAKMRALGERLGVPIKVFGPETHMTAIVRMVQEA